MVLNVDERAVVIIGAQFRQFMRERVRITEYGSTPILPEDVRNLVLTTACLDVFLKNITDTARWN